MSLGKRLLDLARSNITDFVDGFSKDELREVLDEEERAAVDAEVRNTVGSKAGKQARKFRDAAEEAWEKAFEAAQAGGGGRMSGGPTTEQQRRKWYRTLELEPGVTLDEVRKRYRKLLIQYHPDKFATDPEKYKAATEVTRNLTEAYNGLTRELGG